MALTQRQARDYAAHLIATQQFDWDEIAERFNDGNLEQEDCDLVAEALGSCRVVLEWPDGDERIYWEEDR